MRIAAVVAAAGLAVAALPSSSALAQPAAPPAVVPQAAPPAPAPKPKRRGPTAASSVTVTNASANTATEVVVTAEGKTAKIAKPLAPKARAVLKLPKLSGCIVSVAATFEGEGLVDAGEFDVCKEKTIRFTD